MGLSSIVEISEPVLLGGKQILFHERSSTTTAEAPHIPNANLVCLPNTKRKFQSSLTAKGLASSNFIYVFPL